MTPPPRRPRRIDFSVAEAAAIANVKPILIRQWICRGHLRRNSRRRIDGAELVAWLDRRGGTGPHPKPPTS